MMLSAGSNNFRRRAFTLIELMLVMALIVIAVSLIAPRMASFIKGQALDFESRRLFALIHATQSRAVSEGMPMMLWVDEKAGSYGEEAETSGQNGDPKAEELSVDSTLQISVLNGGTGTQTTFKNLPAIRFLPDGTIDEGSPQAFKLMDSAGFSRWLVQLKNRQGYDINNTGN